MFFDLQVNGYAGVDFNADDLPAERIAAACGQLGADGVEGILATIITAPLDAMERRVAQLVCARETSPICRQMIAGIHLEGPFISKLPGYVGAHPASAARPATLAAMERLLEAGEGHVRLVTLAPEQDTRALVTRWLADRNVRVAAGHCNPSRDQLLESLDAGLSLFTHLGNGCPLELPRHDNIIQRVLSLADRLTITFIADGVHVPFFALRNYLQLAGLDRAVVVSDAIAAAGLGPGEFTLGSMTVVVDEQLATWSPDRSHLMGSALTMPMAHRNLVEHVGLSPDDARRLTFENPWRALNKKSLSGPLPSEGRAGEGG
jgi:N-acetylglucosamine-6-phosphate deacetylase